MGSINIVILLLDKVNRQISLCFID